MVNPEPATRANRKRVANQLGTLRGHLDSAVYDALTDAGPLLRSQPDAAAGGIDSVVLLTDGDGFPQGDPHGSSPQKVATLFHGSQGRSRISLFVIDFAPGGCTEPLLWLANTTGGTCYPANLSNSGQQLARILASLSTGG